MARAATGFIRARVVQPIRGLVQLFVDPDTFMERKLDEPSLRTELVAIFLIGVLGVPGFAYAGQQAFEVSEREGVVFMIYGESLTPVFGALLLWIAYAVAFHLLARFYRGRGEIYRMLKGVAWGLLPIGVGNLVKSIALIVALQSVDVTEYLGFEADTSAEEGLNEYIAAGMGDPIGILGGVVFLLSIIASGYLLVSAVQHAKELSREEALRIVAVPVIAYTAYMGWELLRVVEPLG